MVGRAGAGRGLRPGLRRGTAAHRRRLGVVLALHRAEPIRRAAGVPVLDLPARAGARPPVPRAGRHTGPDPGPDLRLPRRRAGPHRRDTAAERHGPSRGDAGPPRGRPGGAGRRGGRALPPGAGRRRGHRPAGTVPAAQQPGTAAAQLAAAPGADLTVRGRPGPARARPGGGVQRLAPAPRPLRRPGRRPPRRPVPGQERPPDPRALTARPREPKADTTVSFS